MGGSTKRPARISSGTSTRATSAGAISRRWRFFSKNLIRRALLPRLEPDAFLPTKIRALSDDRRARATGMKRPGWGWLRLSLASAAFAIAVAAGVFLGTGLSTASYANGESEIVEAYYEAFSQSGFADEWENVIADDQAENNGAL